jgi:hypothetical protein
MQSHEEGRENDYPLVRAGFNRKASCRGRPPLAPATSSQLSVRIGPAKRSRENLQRL